jgi:hypothetical protein
MLDELKKYFNVFDIEEQIDFLIIIDFWFIWCSLLFNINDTRLFQLLRTIYIYNFSNFKYNKIWKDKKKWNKSFNILTNPWMF